MWNLAIGNAYRYGVSMFFCVLSNAIEILSAANAVTCSRALTDLYFTQFTIGVILP